MQEGRAWINKEGTVKGAQCPFYCCIRVCTMSYSNFVSSSAVLPEWQMEMILQQMDYLEGKKDSVSKRQLAQLVALLEGLTPLEEPLVNSSWKI